MSYMVWQMFQVGVVVVLLPGGGQQSHAWRAAHCVGHWLGRVGISGHGQQQLMREAWPNEGLCLEMGQRAHDRSWLAVRMVPFFCLASRVVSGTLPISST